MGGSLRECRDCTVIRNPADTTKCKSAQKAEAQHTERDTIEQKEQFNHYLFLLDDMKGETPEEVPVIAQTHGPVERQRRAPPLLSTYINQFSELLSPYFYFSIFSSFSFRPFRHTAHFFLLAPFPNSIFRIVLAIQLATGQK